MAVVSQNMSTATPITDTANPINISPPASWEGDKMFNIYIHDYCSKRGYRKTAKELMSEAEIPPDATPPINARQGLLFEWWSVFWVLFQAKSNGGGSEDGLIYTAHQAAQRAQQRPGAAQPSQPPTQPLPPQPQQMSRLPNGIPSGNMQQPMNRPPSTYMTNGVVPNGVPMNPMGGQPQPQTTQQMQPGTSMNFGGMGNHPPAQPNGMTGPVSGGSGPPPPPPQGVPNQNMPFQMPQNPQRPPSMMNGVPPQARGAPNGGPFHSSPTMSHSPQHNAGAPGHPAQQIPPGQGPSSQQVHPQGGPGQQPAMAQLGPSPHMTPMNRGPMLPPNGAPPSMGPLNPGQPQLQQQQGPPTPGFQHPQHPGGRPPSRTNTPRGGMMSQPQPSPSLAARQTPGGPMGMGPSSQGQNNLAIPGGMNNNAGMVPGSSPDQMNHDIMQIPQVVMNNIKQELGYGDKDISNLSMNEKQRIILTWRQRQQPRKDAPGPSGMMQTPGQPHQRPPAQRQGNKRSSTSPGEEHETLPSPPEKRIRRSPGEPSALPPYSNTLLPGQSPSGQPPSGQPSHQMNPMIMMRNMNGGPPPQQQQHPGLQQPSMGGPPAGMPPSMMSVGPHGPGSAMSPQQQQIHVNQQHSQQAQHQAQPFRMQKSGAPDHSFGQASGSSGPQFNPTLNRLQNKPSMAGMMPPPSPAMNGIAKDAKQDGNNTNKPSGSNPPSNGQQSGQSHNPDGSPRNPPPSGPSGSGTAPPTPVQSNQPNPQQQQQPQTHLNIMPGPLLGMPSGGAGMAPDISLFDTGFMDSISSEFDPSALFQPNGDINFERDFGQWFNPDDTVLNTGLDMK